MKFIFGIIFYCFFAEVITSRCPALKKCHGAIINDVSYECRSDFDCPEIAKCCSHECYGHKVCRKIQRKVLRDHLPLETFDKDCPKPEKCPGKMQENYYLKCNSNADCSDKFSKCCPFTCFSHNVCLRLTDVEYHYIPSNDTTCKLENCQLNAPKCEKIRYRNNPFCSHGLKCCVGKECSYKPLCKDICPKYFKCKQKYAVRLMKKFQCKHHKDCGQGLHCCYDACADFKICMDLK